jgi:hypothetical protein
MLGIPSKGKFLYRGTSLSKTALIVPGVRRDQKIEQRQEVHQLFPT